MPFLGQWEKALRQKGQFPRENRELTGARAKQCPFHANEIADVEQLVKLEVSFGKLILLCVHLEFRTRVRKGKESGLAKRPISQNAARDTDLHRVVLEVLARFGRIGFDDFRYGFGVTIFGRVGVVTKGFNALQLLDTDGFQRFDHCSPMLSTSFLMLSRIPLMN